MKNNNHTEITDEWVEHVAVGGAILGGGGGGSLNEGINFGKLAVEYGNPRIRSVSVFDASEVILTVSGVGAPAAADSHVKPADYVQAVELIINRLNERGQTVAALMTNEMGGFASVNGLLQSAVTGLPILDAACNGRAHPTGPMGSIGLSGDETVLQAGVGGKAYTEQRHELLVEAHLSSAADTIRQTAEAAGGLVAVARNPITAEYAESNAALSVYDQAKALGEAVQTADDGESAAAEVASLLDGEVAVTGTVDSRELETAGGFDTGTVVVDGNKLTFWNEYMTLNRNSKRVATFPDLITTLDADTGRPISTAEITEGQSVTVVVAPASSLTLGAGMEDPGLFHPVEEAVGKPVVEYAFPEV